MISLYSECQPFCSLTTLMRSNCIRLLIKLICGGNLCIIPRACAFSTMGYARQGSAYMTGPTLSDPRYRLDFAAASLMQLDLQHLNLPHLQRFCLNISHSNIKHSRFAASPRDFTDFAAYM